MRGKGFKQSRKQYAPLLCTYDCNPLLILFQVLHPKSNLHYTPQNIDRSFNLTIDVSIYEKIMKSLRAPGDLIQGILQTGGAFTRLFLSGESLHGPKRSERVTMPCVYVPSSDAILYK